MNRYLEKIAEKANSYADEKLIAAPILGVAGGALAVDQYHRGNITGRETLYHGTSETRADAIRKKGLTPNHTGAGVSKVVSEELARKNKDLVFATNKKTDAATYSSQQKAIDAGKIKSVVDLHGYRNSGEFKQDLSRNFNGKGIVEIHAPTWKKDEFKTVRNPELRTQLQAIKKDPLIDVFYPGGRNKARKDAHKLLQEHVKVFKGPAGVSPSYIKGSTSYKKNSLSEIHQFAKANPKRFLAGTSKGLVGAGLVGLGIYSGISGVKDNAKTN